MIRQVKKAEQVKKADCLLSGHFCFLLCEDSENQGAGNGNGKEKRYLCTD